MNRRALRLGLIVAVVLVALAVGVIAALPQIVRRVAVWQLGVATGRTVTLDAVELELFSGRFALRGLRVVDRDQAPLATIDRLDARFSPRALLRGHLRVVDATLRAPIVRIVRTGPREFNISDLLARKAGGGRPPAITLQRFRLVDGTVTIEDRTVTPARTWRVDVALEARDASTLAGAPPGGATLTAAVAGAPVSLVVTDLKLSPLHAHATLTAREIDVALAALFLPDAGPVEPPRGSVSATATIDHDASAGTLVGLEAGFSGIELRRPGEPRPFLSAPAIKLTVAGLRARAGAVELGRLTVDGGRMVLQDARLAGGQRWQVDGVTFEASNLSSARDAPPGIVRAGATMAGAQVSVWGANVRLAPLELDVTTIVRNVDVALLRVYLPPALPVEPARGVVNATIRARHDERSGTRLALDAGMTGVELRRPTDVVVAPALRVTATDITLERGAVTVGQVAVTGDRLTVEDRRVTPARTWVVQNLAVEAKSLSSRRQDVQGVATLQATVAGATVSAFVTRARLDPLELYATTILRNFDLALLRLYIPADAPVQLEHGVVNATVQVEHTVAAGTKVTGDATLEGLQARGGGAAAMLAVKAPSMRLTLADARRRGTDLSVGHIELTGSGSLADTRVAAARVDLAQLRVTSESLTWPVRAPARLALSARFRDQGELDASGSAQLTAPLPTIAWTAEVALRFRAVDLTPLAAAVPALSGLAGRTRASLTANVAYGASLTARVRGDAGGARFALAEGSRTLVSVRRVDATGLDVQWPERVTINELRVFQPYALVERDRQGAFPLLTRFARRPVDGAAPAAAAPAGARPAAPAIAIGAVIVESGSALVVDDSGTAPTRVEVPRVGLTVRDFTWPASRPATIALDAGLADGGTVTAQGTVRAEPLGVDLTLALKDVEIAPLQKYLGFRAGVRGRIDASLTAAGPLSPTPRLAVRGEGGARNITIADGPRSVITVQEIRATGIDAAWPERVTLERVRVRRSWALIERDRQGRFLLRSLLERVDAPAPRAPAGPPAPPPAATAFTVRELILEDQGATIVDGVTTPPARVEVAGARVAVQDLTWPSRGPMKVEVASPMPAGGRLNVTGTLDLEPFRLDARAVLDDVAIDPAQPYLPFEGRVAGHVTGELAVKLALSPVSAQLTGATRLRAFALSDVDRAVVTVGRVEVTGIDVDWPRRIALGNVLFRRPRLLIERDASGDFLLRRLATPHWETIAPAAPAPASAGPATAPPVAAAPPTIEIATFRLERASARFVDQTTAPPYAEELSEVEMAFTGLTTVPGRRARFTGGGEVGGGTFKLAGEVGQGQRTLVDFKLDLRDFIVARANPYIDRFTGWTATQGRFNATAAYTINGTQVDAHQDVVVRGLEVERVDERDEVERRLGLPFGFLVSLLKDSHGEIKLSLPVAGDLATREFDFEDAVWSAVKSVAIRLLALPFSRVGSLFFSHDSKVEAVAITPVAFEAGSTRLTPGMEAHVEQVAKFFTGAPAVTAILKPILTQDDVEALRKAGPQPPPAEALHDLGAGRLEVVRQALARVGSIDAARLKGNVPRTPLVESGGAARVEFDLRQ